MKEITLFYMEGCPYCVNAKRALGELWKEKAEYSEVKVNWVDENKETALASRYDYYYVPTIFYGEEKLYEAHPSENYDAIKAKIREALDQVLA